MSEWEFIADMEQLFERHQMKRESVDAILACRIIEIEFYLSTDQKKHATYMPFHSGNIILLNMLRSGHEIELSLAHEIGHIFYDRRVYRLFRKYDDDYFNNRNAWTSHISHHCQEDLTEWAAERFCRENPGYLRGVLTEIVEGKSYPQIEVSYALR